MMVLFKLAADHTLSALGGSVEEKGADDLAPLMPRSVACAMPAQLATHRAYVEFFLLYPEGGHMAYWLAQLVFTSEVPN